MYERRAQTIHMQIHWYIVKWNVYTEIEYSKPTEFLHIDKI